MRWHIDAPARGLPHWVAQQQLVLPDMNEV